MKSIANKFLLLICSFLCGVSVSFAQSNPILARFQVSETNGTVFLSWAITQGSTCNGIQILRSTDSINFIGIGSIPGICGSTSFEQPYNFIDENPVKNKANYYRLSLGGSGFSEILSVEIIALENNGYQIRPNPITANALIYFSNEKNQEHQLVVSNLRGNKIFTATTKQNFFELNTASISSGVYAFTISLTGDTPKAKGKFVVK